MAHGRPGDRIGPYYDEYGEREWHRFEREPADRINLEIPQRFLARLVNPGDRVLEVGAGPGRFTIQLARLGARVTVVDISPGQLQLNRVKVAEAGCEDAVERREHADVTDLSRFDDERRCELVDASAANLLSLRADPMVADLDPPAWERLVA